MINILKKMFEANPGKSTIRVKGNCSDCGREITISITPASEGFGLQGGTLYKFSPSAYFVQCAECYKINPKTEVAGRTQRALEGAILTSNAAESETP